MYKSNDVIVKFINSLREGADQGQAPGFMLSDNYEADLERYQKAQSEIESLGNYYGGAPIKEIIGAYNDSVQSNAPLLMTEIYTRATHGSSLHQRFTNENNIEITKSSDAVQFLNPPTTMDGGMFDIRTPKTSTTTPQFFSFSNQGLADGSVDVTLVRIPKGQSITVRYTLKSGQPYLSGKQMITGKPLAVQLFAKETADAYRTSNKKLTDADIQDVYTIESTITNNGGVHDGDMVVGVANRTGAPFMIGVSNGTSAEDRITWNLNTNDPRLAFSYQTETVLRNKQKVTAELVREVTLPTPKSTDPVDPATVAFIEPVKWVAKYTKPYSEKPPVPKETPVQPPLIPEPKKPEEKPLPTPPKKEELPKRPELKAIASGSNSFVVKSRKATRPSINVERIQYVAEGRVSAANSLVVRTKNEVKRAGSGNSFIIRRM